MKIQTGVSLEMVLEFYRSQLLELKSESEIYELIT